MARGKKTLLRIARDMTRDRYRRIARKNEKALVGKFQSEDISQQLKDTMIELALKAKTDPKYLPILRQTATAFIPEFQQKITSTITPEEYEKEILNLFFPTTSEEIDDEDHD